MNFNDRIQLISGIEGEVDSEECEILYELAKKCKKGVIVEIGSYKGLSTVCLGYGSMDGFKKRVYGVDTFVGTGEKANLNLPSYLSEFRKNIFNNRLHKLVKPRVGLSIEVAKTFKQKIGLLFIDGGHAYEDIKSDFKSWSPKMIKGGVIAFHDIDSWTEPTRFINENIRGNRKYERLGQVKSVFYIRV